MENTVRVIQLVHRVILSILLLLIAIIPLITQVNVITAFVVLPTFLITILLLSVVIEQKLASLALKKSNEKSTQLCLIKKCLHKSCLS